MGDDAQGVNEISFDEADLTLQVIDDLTRNRAADSIERLHFLNCDVASDSKPFFEDWQFLKRVIFENTKVPATWIRVIAEQKIECLVIVGDCEELTFGKLVAAMKPGTALKQILICNGKTTAADLEGASVKVPDSTFHAVAFPGNTRNNPEIRLSESNLESRGELEAVFSSLKAALQALKPPAQNKFNPPATQKEIAKLETRLGIPLHHSLRSYLEIHNGQPTIEDELVSMERLLPIDDILGQYGEWRAYGEPEEDVEYDFNPDYDSWVNPNVVPIGTSEDHVIGMNMISGRLVQWYSEDRRLTGEAESIEAYLQRILAKVEAGDVERHPDDSPMITVYFD